MTENQIRVEVEGGFQRAETVCQWFLGDGSWARMILNAYFNENDPDYLEAKEGMES